MMVLLVSGVLLFAVVHLVPSLAPGLKQRWLGKLGEGGYKGTFSLLLLLSFALMIFGWRSTPAEYLYMPSPALKHPAMGLIFIAFLLLVVSNRNSRLARIVRHPQLTGVLIWAIAHLMLNGDVRSTVLFGGLACWALVEIIAINRRDGAWVKPEPPSLVSELITVLITVALVVGTIFLHPYLSGMPVITS